jgi:hypothetical protein
LAVLRLAPSARTDAPEDTFSAARAFEEMRRLDLVRPHPVGDDGEVRARVAERLRALGYAVETPGADVCSPDATCAHVVNVVARLDGAEPAPAIVLTAHYDSVRGGPGVADDGAGVAAILEVARAMKRAPRPRRPIVFLVADGEEAGSLGARAFAKSPEGHDVGVVINLEARGGDGPSLLFETSKGNAALVADIARSLPHPVTSSLLAAIYASLPNSTDLSVYKSAGLAGLNFAFIGAGGRYHTAYDDLAHLDPGSLQDQGDHALAAVRAFERSERWPPSANDRDAVFFDVGSLFILYWPVSWTLWLALLGAGSVAAASVLLARRSGTSARALAGAFGVIVAAWLGTALAAAAAAALLLKTNVILSPWPPAGLAPSVVAVSIAVLVVLVVGLMLRRCGAVAAWIALWSAWAALALASSIAAPTAGHLFVVPTLVAGACGLFSTLRPPDRFSQTLVLALPAAALALLWAPLAAILYQALGAPALPVIALAAAPPCLALIPPIAALDLPRPFRLALAPAVTALAALGWLAVSPRFSAEEPDHVPLEYVEDADAHKAAWVLTMADFVPPTLAAMGFRDGEPFPWSPGGEHSGPFADALPLGLAAPELDVAPADGADAARGDTRSLRAVLRSKREAGTVALFVRADRVAAASVEGVAVPEEGRPASGWWKIETRSAPAGVHVDVTLRGKEPVDAVVLDESAGVPEPGAELQRARPAWAASAQDGDLTVVVRRQRL